MRRLTITLLLAAAPVGAGAQWQVVNEPVPFSVESEVSVALVENDSGESLRVYVDDHGTVRGIFGIDDGFERLADSTCPTYRVDEREPVVLAMGDGRCAIEPKRAHFSLGALEEEEIHSLELHRLMNGRRVVFRYHLEELGYRETAFSLRRSKFAVERAVGHVSTAKD